MFRINPTDKGIDEGIRMVDSVVMFHNIKSPKQFVKVLYDTIDLNKNELIYIHYYTADEIYSVGIKKRDRDL